MRTFVIVFIWYEIGEVAMICACGKGGGNKEYVSTLDEETSCIMTTRKTQKAVRK
jgi:hypothetical protein